MKPLNIVLIVAGIFLLIGWFLIKALTPIIPLAKLIWPLVIGVIILGSAFSIWRRFSKQVEAFFGIDLVRKISLTVLLAAVAYIPYFYFCYWWLAPKLVQMLGGISYNHALLLVTILQAPMAGTIYYLVSPIWPDRGKISRGFLTISIIGSLVIAYMTYQIPYQFFDHRTGKNRFWVSDTEKRIYYSPGYGIEDGKPLRPGTAEDAKKFKEKVTIKDFIKPKETRAKCPLSGTFEVPAGEMVYTGILVTDISKGPFLRLAQVGGKPKTYWFVNGAGKDIKIERKVYLIKIISPGELQLKGGPEPTKVRAEVIF
jgi:hypothetical protein